MRDRIRLFAKGGDGGLGCDSYRRSRHERYGKADGGNGGRGGDVILECSPSVWDFSGLQHHSKARRGGNGAPKNMIGSRGEDKVVLVPVGTVVHLVEGELPCHITDSSSKDLFPWEIPGSLVGDDKSDQPSDSAHLNGATTQEAQDICSALPSHMENAMGANAAGPIKASSVVSFPHSNENSVDWRKKYYSDEEGGDASDGVDSDNIACEGEEEEEINEKKIQYNVAELTENGQRLVVACGGMGALGSVSRNLSSTFKRKRGLDKESVDNLEDEDPPSTYGGSPGSASVLILELKSIADVGLVGFPNAGKSTLLGSISRAQPAVGHYAFTTLRPYIGKLKYDDYFSVSVADIPGLIKGAHMNRGLGHDFLRHIERTKVLVYVLDLAAALNGQKGNPPWEQLRDLVLELEFYRKGLSDRPSLVVANKIDEDGAEEVFEELRERVHGVPIFPVCAVLEEGVPELKVGLRTLVDGEETPRLNLDAICLD